MDTARVVFILFSISISAFYDTGTGILLRRSGSKKKCH